MVSQTWELFNFVFLSRYVSYANYFLRKQRVPCIIRMLIFQMKFQKKKARKQL